jgi:hypothetical protein
MVPVLDEVEAERSTKGPTRSYMTHELERAVLFLRMRGMHTYAAARGLLAGDRSARCGRALGFDVPRRRVERNLRVVCSLDGVPAEKTVWRHLNRFGLDRHAAAYKKLFEALVDDHFIEWSSAIAPRSSA